MNTEELLSEFIREVHKGIKATTKKINKHFHSVEKSNSEQKYIDHHIHNCEVYTKHLSEVINDIDLNFQEKTRNLQF